MIHYYWHIFHWHTILLFTLYFVIGYLIRIYGIRENLKIEVSITWSIAFFDVVQFYSKTFTVLIDCCLITLVITDKEIYHCYNIGYPIFLHSFMHYTYNIVIHYISFKYWTRLGTFVQHVENKQIKYQDKLIFSVRRRFSL